MEYKKEKKKGYYHCLSGFQDIQSKDNQGESKMKA